MQVGIVRAEEFLEDQGVVGFVDADAAVFDGDQHEVAFLPPGNINAPAVRRVFDGVQHDVAERLHQPLRIRLDGRQVAQAARRKHQAALLDRLGERLNRQAHDVFDAGGGEAQVHRVHVELAHVEHCADQVFEPVRRLAQICRHARRLVLVEHPLFVHGFHDVGVAANLGERGAQFVRGDGDEIGLDAVELFELLFGGLQRAVEFGLFGFAAAQIGHQARIAQGDTGLVRQRHQQVEVLGGVGIVGGFGPTAQNADGPPLHDNRGIGAHAQLAQEGFFVGGRAGIGAAEVHIVVEQGGAVAEQHAVEWAGAPHPPFDVGHFAHAALEWFEQQGVAARLFEGHDQAAAPHAQHFRQRLHGDIDHGVQFDHAGDVFAEAAQNLRGAQHGVAQQPPGDGLDQQADGHVGNGCRERQGRQDHGALAGFGGDLAGRHHQAEKDGGGQQSQDGGRGDAAKRAADVEDAVGQRAIGGGHQPDRLHHPADLGGGRCAARAQAHAHHHRRDDQQAKQRLVGDFRQARAVEGIERGQYQDHAADQPPRKRQRRRDIKRRVEPGEPPTLAQHCFGRGRAERGVRRPPGRAEQQPGRRAAHLEIVQHLRAEQHQHQVHQDDGQHRLSQVPHEQRLIPRIGVCIGG